MLTEIQFQAQKGRYQDVMIQLELAVKAFYRNCRNQDHNQNFGGSIAGIRGVIEETGYVNEELIDLIDQIWEEKEYRNQAFHERTMLTKDRGGNILGFSYFDDDNNETFHSADMITIHIANAEFYNLKLMALMPSATEIYNLLQQK